MSTVSKTIAALVASALLTISSAHADGGSANNNEGSLFSESPTAKALLGVGATAGSAAGALKGLETYSRAEQYERAMAARGTRGPKSGNLAHLLMLDDEIRVGEEYGDNFLKNRALKEKSNFLRKNPALKKELEEYYAKQIQKGIAVRRAVRTGKLAGAGTAAVALLPSAIALGMTVNKMLTPDDTLAKQTGTPREGKDSAATGATSTGESNPYADLITPAAKAGGVK